jgi:hypothetical protein
MNGNPSGQGAAAAETSRARRLLPSRHQARADIDRHRQDRGVEDEGQDRVQQDDAARMSRRHGDIRGLRGAADRVGEVQEIDIVGIGLPGKVEAGLGLAAMIVDAGIVQREERVQQRPGAQDREAAQRQMRAALRRRDAAEPDDLDTDGDKARARRRQAMTRIASAPSSCRSARARIWSTVSVNIVAASKAR